MWGWVNDDTQVVLMLGELFLWHWIEIAPQYQLMKAVPESCRRKNLSTMARILAFCRLGSTVRRDSASCMKSSAPSALCSCRNCLKWPMYWDDVRTSSNDLEFSRKKQNKKKNPDNLVSVSEIIYPEIFSMLYKCASHKYSLDTYHQTLLSLNE